MLRRGWPDREGIDIRGKRTAHDRAVNALLIDVCRGRAPRRPQGKEIADEVVRAARYHRIGPLTHVALRGARPHLADLLKVDRDLAFWHHSRVLALLGEIETALEGIPWLAFKGPILSELAHPVPGLRSYKDLDLLVDPTDLRAVCGRLLGTEWNVIDSNETLRRPELSGEVRLASRRRVLADLHWSMVVTISGRRMFPIPTHQLLERRTRVKAGPKRIWALELVDSLVHVCLHAALSGATRLLHLIDADQLARQIQDWDAVAQRSREWGATAQTALVLGRANRLLRTPLPSDLTDKLGLPTMYTYLMSAVDRAWPTEALRQDESIPRLVARAARPGVMRTGGSVLRNGALGLLHRIRLEAAPTPRIPADRDVIDEYLSAVEAAAQHPTSRL
jgi:Uncharacterised nucleotidyltransferase